MNKVRVVESLMRAKQALVAAGHASYESRVQIDHRRGCIVDDDPDHLGRCDCYQAIVVGKQTNEGIAIEEIDKALKEVIG